MNQPLQQQFLEMKILHNSTLVSHKASGQAGMGYRGKNITQQHISLVRLAGEPIFGTTG